MPSEIIFLTGGTGYLGSHILNQLLAKGYHVKAAVRQKKAAQFKQHYQSHGAKFEAVIIEDISHSQFNEELKGVNAVIHTAAPLAFYETTAEGQLRGAIDGALNVLRQAEKAGVTKIVVTSTLLTAFTPQYTFSAENDWFATSKEEALKLDGTAAYMAAKTLAEKAIWEFAESHPKLDITTINPPYLYGPATKEFIAGIPTPNLSAISTLINIYKLLNTEGAYPDYPLYIDVRDVAKAHIGALSSPPPSSAGRKRIHINSPHDTVFADIIVAIREKRPQLKDRLTKVDPPQFPFKKLPSLDLARVKEVTGLTEADFVPVNDTFVESIDSILELEKQWKANGHSFEAPK
jgi:nucleoside-diphosphate-sugar epimerase